jgi:hypothetical protein
MPKKKKLTANGVFESYGWIPPVEEFDDEKGDKVIGKVSDYNAEGVGSTFATIFKENLGFDLQADVEDARTRLIFMSDNAKYAYNKYLRGMREADIMPDSPDKVKKIKDTADAFLNVLYRELTKGRFVFIPLGEKEPRQLRYDAENKRFVVSMPLKSVDLKDIQKQFAPKDEKGNTIVLKQQDLIELHKPYEPDLKNVPEFKVRKPRFEVVKTDEELDLEHTTYMSFGLTYKKDKMLFRVIDPGEEPQKIMPPELRLPPEKPADMLENKTYDQWVNEEYERLKEEANINPPRLVDLPKEPLFNIKPPKEVKNPGEENPNVIEPVKPVEQQTYERIQTELEKYIIEPEFPDGYYQLFMDRPAPLYEVPKPVLEEPVPPQEPAYENLEPPKFKYTLEPKYEFLYPNELQFEDPGPIPKMQPFFEYPERPVLRPEPQFTMTKPNYFVRFFNWKAIDRYREAEAEYQADHAKWVEERDSFGDVQFAYNQIIEAIDKNNAEIAKNYISAMQSFTTIQNRNLERAEEYEKTVKDLQSENERILQNYQAKLQAYETDREKPDYEEELAKYQQELQNWENTHQEKIDHNAQLKQEYLNSQAYKEYDKANTWYKTHMKPFELDVNKTNELKEQYTKQYEDELAKLKNLQKEHERYDIKTAAARDYFTKVVDKQIKDNPEIANRKEDLINDYLAKNEQENAKYRRSVQEFRANRTELLNQQTKLENNPTRLKYIEDYKKYEIETQTITIDKEVKDRYDAEINNPEPEIVRTKEEQEEYNKALDKNLAQANRAAVNQIVANDKNEDEIHAQMARFDRELRDLEDDEDIENYSPENIADYSFVDDGMHEGVEITRHEHELIKYHEYQKDLRQYEALKRRHDEKHKQWEIDYPKAVENNENFKENYKAYEKQLDELFDKAKKNVDKKIEENKKDLADYDVKFKEYEKEKILHAEKVEQAREDYNAKWGRWYGLTETYKRERKEYNEEMAKYNKLYDEYREKYQKFQDAWDDYIAKDKQYEIDKKKNEQIALENNANLKYYNEKVNEQAQKLCVDPKMKDFHKNMDDFMNCEDSWERKLYSEKKVYKWKSKFTDDKKMDEYFNEHQKKLDKFESFKNKANSVTKISKESQEKYEDEKAILNMTKNVVESARPIFQKLNERFILLKSDIDKEKSLDLKKYTEYAAKMMYYEVIEDRLWKEYKGSNDSLEFDGEELQKYFDYSYVDKATEEIRKDPVFAQRIKEKFNAANESSDAKNRVLRTKYSLKDGNEEFLNIFNTAHQKAREVVKNPIFKEDYLGPLELVSKRKFEDTYLPNKKPQNNNKAPQTGFKK